MGRHRLRRRLVELTDVPFSVFMQGTTFDGIYIGLAHFATNSELVAEALGVPVDEVILATLVEWRPPVTISDDLCCRLSSCTFHLCPSPCLSVESVFVRIHTHLRR